MASAAPRRTRARAALLAAAACGLLAGPAHAQERLPRAQANYLLHCSGCHLPDGAGKPAAGIPDMRATLPRLLASAAGRAFVIQVPGTSGSDLSDAEIAELFNWMVPAFGPGVASPGFTRQEVARYRHDPLDDVMARRASILPAPR